MTDGRPRIRLFLSVLLIWCFFEASSATFMALAQDDLLSDFEQLSNGRAANPAAQTDAPTPNSERQSTPDVAATELPKASEIANQTEIDADLEPVVADKTAYRLVVQTPINYAESLSFRNSLEQLSQQAGNKQIDLVIQFQSREISSASEDNLIGRGSEFEPSLSIARTLTGPLGGQFNSIAYVEQSVVGHAVLVALACQTLAVAPQAEIGLASVDEASVDESMRQTYTQIAKQRGKIPEAAIASMLESEAQLFEVQTTDSETLYVNADMLQELQRLGKILREERLTLTGQLGSINGQQLRFLKWSDASPANELELLELFNLDRIQDSNSVAVIENPIPVLFELQGEVTQVQVNRCIRTLREARRLDNMNVCLIAIDSLGGNLEQSNRLATFLIDLQKSGVQTVAIIDKKASGDAAMIAMSCQIIYAVEGARFGGDGQVNITPDEIRDLKTLWENLAARSNKTPAHFYGVISSSVPLHEYIDRNGRVLLANPELFDRMDNNGRWTENEQFKPLNEMDLNSALSRRWINGEISERSEIVTKLNIEALPPPRKLTQIEKWATALASNQLFTSILLIVGIATFTTELTAPGSIIFLFISLLCFTTFFWLQFLNGTVESLEIILFIAGLICIAMEIFVIPGFGVFGIGGMVLCIAGIILASQSFVIPASSIQWSRFAWNLSAVSAACLISLVILLVFSDQLQKSPFFRVLELAPPQSSSKPEVQVEPTNMAGKTGRTITRCAPYGRATFEGTTYEVVAEDAYIEESTLVRVIETRGRVLKIERV